MKTHKKGQGALEYLLLIGGAILVAVVVLVVLSGLGTAPERQTNETTARAICSAKTVNPATACTGSGTGTEDVNVGTSPNQARCECAVNGSRCEATNCVFA